MSRNYDRELWIVALSALAVWLLLSALSTAV